MSRIKTRRQVLIAVAMAALATMWSPTPGHTDNSCQPITAAVLEIAAVNCTQVLPRLQASNQFPDVFAGTGKIAGLCYAATGLASAMIGDTPVTIESTSSAWTTDFVPVLLGGTDNLGTVITQLTIAGLHGRSQANLYTRDTIDLSQILTTGLAPEEDVIVGGSAYFTKAQGTYRVASQPEDAQASKVLLTNLTGVICY